MEHSPSPHSRTTGHPSAARGRDAAREQHAYLPMRTTYPEIHGRTVSEDISEYLSVVQRPPRRRAR